MESPRPQGEGSREKISSDRAYSDDTMATISATAFRKSHGK
jgi:hypothetical protein